MKLYLHQFQINAPISLSIFKPAGDEDLPKRRRPNPIPKRSWTNDLADLTEISDWAAFSADPAADPVPCSVQRLSHLLSGGGRLVGRRRRLAVHLGRPVNRRVGSRLRQVRHRLGLETLQHRDQQSVRLETLQHRRPTVSVTWLTATQETNSQCDLTHCNTGDQQSVHRGRLTMEQICLRPKCSW